MHAQNVPGTGTGNGTKHIRDKLALIACRSQLGVVAHSCNPATGKLELVDGLRSGVLLMAALCRSGVRTKPGVNMASSAEARLIREISYSPVSWLKLTKNGPSYRAPPVLEFGFVATVECNAITPLLQNKI